MRKMIGAIAAVALAGGALMAASLPVQAEPLQPVTNPAALVNTFIGSEGQGNTFPGATAPFGMTQVSPTSAWFAGYRYTDTRIYGFGTQYISGAGCWEQGGTLPAMPTTGVVGPGGSFNTSSATTFNYANYGSTYTHAGEVGQAGYYKTRLTSYGGIDVETTATTRVGVQRYTFPATSNANVFLNTGQANGVAGTNPGSTAQMKILGSSITVEEDGLITGAIQAQGFCSGQGYTYWQYFAAKASVPIESFGTWNASGGTPGRATVSKTTQALQGAWLTFDTTANQTVQINTAISYTSIDGAKRNLAAEGLTQTGDLVAFDDVRAATQQQWNDYLLRVKAYGGSNDDQVTFYTALYHALIQPAVATDVDGAYFGFDKQIHTATGWTYYQFFSLWDTYRTQNQLIASFWPERARDLGRSILAIYAQGGWLPRWAYASYETNCMTGDPVTAYLVDLWRYGALDVSGGVVLPGSDVLSGQDTPLNLVTAYEALLKNVDQVPATASQFSGRSGNTTYIANGYIAHVSNQSQKGQSEDRRRAGSATYEYAQSDCAMALLADATGHSDDARRLADRAGNWRNVWDATLADTTRGFTGFPRSKNAAGTWSTSGLTASGSDSNGLEEGTAWQYQFLTWQDWPGFVSQVGGKDKALARLDTFFETSRIMDGSEAWKTHAINNWVSGALTYSGAKYNPNNEPDIQAPWYYSYLGQPAKVSAIARAAQRLFTNGSTGVTGNDDLGTMSAWYALTVLGLYPGIPGSGDLLLSAPVFEQVDITLPSGSLLTITAPGASSEQVQYIDSVQFNGQPWGRNYLNVADFLSGGTLALTLTTSPDSDWGTADGAVPLPLCSSQAYFRSTVTEAVVGTALTGQIGVLTGPSSQLPTGLTARIDWDHGGSTAVLVSSGALARTVSLAEPVDPPEPGITVTGSLVVLANDVVKARVPVSYQVSGSPILADVSDLTTLRALVLVAGLFEQQESRYTPASFAVFAEALAKARAALVADPLLKSGVLAAIDALRAAQAALILRVDPTPLADLIAAAQAILDNSAQYLTAKLPDLIAAVAQAEVLVSSPDLTQDQVTAGSAALLAAMAAVLPRADLTLLRAYVELADSLDST
ncbi:MAG: GH92 family glycosyl hydrolase, partial [Bifidobacteriaceae bacterium]|nr:GH92 family glycosyl hydrolase [Bifidobacteriaceae bacterium]